MSLYTKYVVRNGKRVKKWKTTKEGKYRVEYDENGKPREVRITAGERRKRKLGQKKAKLKRKAKQGLIDRKKKRSFKVRDNVGLSYDKKHPQINTSRENSKLPSQNPKSSYLHPKLAESMNEDYLFEQPHAYLYDDDGEEVYWDFCSEEDPDNWMLELVRLYKEGQIKSLNNLKNFLPKLRVDRIDLKEITENLTSNLFFLSCFRNDIKSAGVALKYLCRKYLPKEFF